MGEGGGGVEDEREERGSRRGRKQESKEEKGKESGQRSERVKQERTKKDPYYTNLRTSFKSGTLICKHSELASRLQLVMVLMNTALDDDIVHLPQDGYGAVQWTTDLSKQRHIPRAPNSMDMSDQLKLFKPT